MRMVPFGLGVLAAAFLFAAGYVVGLVLFAVTMEAAGIKPPTTTKPEE